MAAFHAVPFHTSVNAKPFKVVAEASMLAPTAAQLVAETHDTSVRTGSLAPAGSGTFCRVRVLPFQRARITPMFAVAAEMVSPATTQRVSDRQETLVACTSMVPGGLGGVWRVHFAPFHVSTSARSVLPNSVPTATQLLTATQDTALSVASVVPFGSGGAGTGRSEVPFQVRANGRK